jgi:hypothetical protein
MAVKRVETFQLPEQLDELFRRRWRSERISLVTTVSDRIITALRSELTWRQVLVR